MRGTRERRHWAAELCHFERKWGPRLLALVAASLIAAAVFNDATERLIAPTLGMTVTLSAYLFKSSARARKPQGDRVT